MNFEREDLFRMLAAQDWDGIGKVLHENAKAVRSNNDPIIQQAINFFEAEFFTYASSLTPQGRKRRFESTHLIIEMGRHGFSSTFVDRFVDERLQLLRDMNSSNLLDYAKSHQYRPLAAQIIRDIQAQRPDQVAAIKRQHTSIRSTAVNAGKSHTTKLFKSKQEENFFQAVRMAFPTHHPYPNVALSCVLDYEAIRDMLTPQQREYFFKAIIDNVLFDVGSGYEPRFFIELDSLHHDDPRAAINDEMKDAIFRAANVKLIRIRPLNQQAASIEELAKLVDEVMRGR